MSDRESGKVRSVEKAMDLLACLAEAGMPLPLGELSRRTGIPKATVHGLLAAMRSSAVVEQSDTDGKYRLGVRLFEYGCVVSSGWNVLEAAAEPMRQVAEKTGESVSISALDRGEVLIMDCADAHSNFRVVSERGARMPIHCTSQGKLLLAYLTPAERRTVLRNYDFVPYTPHSHTCLESIEQELKEIRSRGYAVENGEYRIGLCSVAAPVFDVNGRAVCAICVVGMFPRADTPEMERASALLRDAAKKISYSIGYREEHPAEN